MNCKCKHLDDIFCGKDEFVLFFYDQRVIKEAKEKIQNLGFEVASEDDAIRIKLQEAKKDVCAICEGCGWSDAEQEGIMSLLRDSKEPLTLSQMKAVKTLSQICAVCKSSEIADIIRKKAFTSYFQPIVDLQTSMIYGYEALLRGVKDDGSIIPPGSIIDIARRGDMLFYLDRAARETALRTAAEKKIDKKVFINFIPTVIYNPNYCLLDTIRWAKQLEFDPKNIVFEVVETEKVLDTEHLKGILEFYKIHGFMVALDDIGSGYSSLGLLSSIRPDIIKIDREIITNIDKDPLKQSIFKALINVANDHGIMVLAEGVETLPEAEWVQESDAHLAQGYFWGKPTAEPIRALG
ncbi:MAG: EAL domain-containing protein [Deltaproteobacteria bacterium]